MSVILTAGKRAVKPKSAKPKKKRSAQSAVFNPTPPLSSHKTSVWFWELDGVATTVMLSKDSYEVWCNGTVLDTIDGFAEDMDCGGSIDFSIYVEQTDVEHKARIKREATGSSRDGLKHQLFVDGFMILEHTSVSPHGLQRTGSAADDLSEATDAYDPYTHVDYPFSAPPDPPCYEEAMAGDDCPHDFDDQPHCVDYASDQGVGFDYDPYVDSDEVKKHQ